MSLRPTFKSVSPRGRAADQDYGAGTHSGRVATSLGWPSIKKHTSGNTAMARFRTRKSQSRSTTSSAFVRSIRSFRRRFPRLLNLGFGKRSRAASVDLEARPASRRRRRRSLQSLRPTSLGCEQLEVRSMLSISAGTLDPTLNTVGYSAADSGYNDQGLAVAYNPITHDTIVAGQSNNQFGLAAYMPDGQLDASFGTGGVVVFQPTGSNFSAIDAVAIDSSGNIVVGGWGTFISGGQNFVVARFDSTGHIDNTFGTGGFVSTDIGGGSDQINAITFDHSAPLTANANIVVAGQTIGATEHAAFARYTSSGVLDPTFGVGATGVITTTGTGANTDEANGIAIDGSGNIFAVGQKTPTSSHGAAVFALGADGASIVRTTPSVGTASNFTALTAAPGGGYFAAGTADGKFVTAKLTAAGALDTSFNGTGSVETAFNSSTGSQANAIAVQSDGKIVVAGNEVDATTSLAYVALARYNADGTLDSAFNTSGTQITDISLGTAATTAAGLLLEPDGKIEVAGTTGFPTTMASVLNDFFLARYVANNTPTGSGSATFDPIVQNETNSAGNSVASLVSQLAMADTDGNPLGIAITNVDDSNGTWQFSTDGGANWSAISNTVSDSGNALLLAQTTSSYTNLIRFVPNAGYYTATSPSSSITIRAWDQTQGTSGSYYSSVNSNASANLNSFSDSTPFSASIWVQQAPSVAYVNSTWSGSSQNQTVTDSEGKRTLLRHRRLRDRCRCPGLCRNGWHRRRRWRNYR